MAHADKQKSNESQPESVAINLSGSAYKVPVDQYDGRELKPFDGRPGAMDAFMMPSLINGMRAYRWR